MFEFRLSHLFLAAILLSGCSLLGQNAQKKTIWVGPDLVDCVGAFEQKCLLTKEVENDEWGYFYDSIEGFTHKVGTSYILEVEITEIPNPPADASSLRYVLIRIVSES